MTTSCCRVQTLPKLALFAPMTLDKHGHSPMPQSAGVTPCPPKFSAKGCRHCEFPVGSMEWIFPTTLKTSQDGRDDSSPAPVVWHVLPHGTSALVLGLTRPAAQDHGCGMQQKFSRKIFRIMPSDLCKNNLRTTSAFACCGNHPFNILNFR